MWTDPAGHVWTTGEMVTAANMNTYIKDNLLALYSPPACRLYSTAAAQSPASGAFSSLTFNAERYNVGSMHSTITNPTRATATVVGRYVTIGNVEWAFNATGYRMLAIYVNGTTSIAQVEHDANEANTQMQVSAEWLAALNDYFELRAWQNSGAGLAVNVVSSYSPEFSASWRGN